MESVENRLTEIRDILNEMGIAVIDAANQKAMLRDQFAMAILSGAAAGLNTIHDAEQFAKNVYLMADFMMKAREAE